MSYVINSSDFQKLSGASGGPVSMSDIVGALRLLNENIEYLKNFPDDKISIDMKEHLEIDREFLLVQAQHNIDSRKKSLLIMMIMILSSLALLPVNDDPQLASGVSEAKRALKH